MLCSGLIIRTTPANPDNIINQLLKAYFLFKKRMAPNATNIGIVCMIAEKLQENQKQYLSQTVRRRRVHKKTYHKWQAF